MSRLNTFKLLTMEKNLEKSTQSSLFQFDDYRDFLRERYFELKAANPKFSYRYLAKRIESTDNYFKNVFDKKRNVGLDRVTKVAGLFKLDPIETQLLIFHVLYYSIHDPSLKEFYKQHIESYQQRQGWFERFQSNNYQNNVSHQMTSQWLRGTIMELFRLENFVLDAVWVQNILLDGHKYSLDEISTALQDLVASGIVKKVGERWVVEDLHLVSADYTAEEHLSNQNLLKKASEFMAFPNLYSPKAGGLGTFAVNSDEANLIMDACLDFNNKVIQIVNNSKNPDMLMSFCGFTYTLTKPSTAFVQVSSGKQQAAEAPQSL